MWPPGDRERSPEDAPDRAGDTGRAVSNHDPRRALPARARYNADMRRDWPLMAAGFGIVAISATLVACTLLGYAFAPATVRGPCTPPKPPATLIDGCGLRRERFGDWIVQPWVIAALAFAFVLLVIAGATIGRGLTQRARV
jgi:hypothetical protein